jgi:hypothetical protein
VEEECGFFCQSIKSGVSVVSAYFIKLIYLAGDSAYIYMELILSV